MAFRNPSNVVDILVFVARLKKHIPSDKTAMIPNLCEECLLFLCRTTLMFLGRPFDWLPYIHLSCYILIGKD
jgi:hypothetical protein